MKVKRLFWGFVFLSGLALLSSAHPVLAQMEHLSQDTVVATRAGVDLTVGHIDQEMAKMPANVRAGYLEDPQRFGRLIDSLLLTVQLAAEANKQGITLSAEEREEAGDEHSLEYLNKLAAKLLSQEVSEREDAEFELLAKEQYRTRKYRYASEEQFTLSHFRLDISRQGPIAAKILAEAVRGRVLAGESLSKVAAEISREGDEVSEDVTLTLADVLRGGQLLVDGLNQIGKRPGISEVLEDETGFHLIELTHYAPSVAPPYEDIKSRMIQDLKEESIHNARTTYLRSHSLQDVTLNDPVILLLPDRYKDGEDAGHVEKALDLGY